MKHNRNNAKSTILLFGISRLAHVVASESVLDIEVDIENVVSLILFNDGLKLLVFPAYLLLQ